MFKVSLDNNKSLKGPKSWLWFGIM